MVYHGNGCAFWLRAAFVRTDSLAHIRWAEAIACAAFPADTDNKGHHCQECHLHLGFRARLWPPSFHVCQIHRADLGDLVRHSYLKITIISLDFSSHHFRQAIPMLLAVQLYQVCLDIRVLLSRAQLPHFRALPFDLLFQGSPAHLEDHVDRVCRVDHTEIVLIN